MNDHSMQPEQDVSQKKTNLLLRYPLASFFLLAYLISWSISLFARPGLLPFTTPPVVVGLSGLLYHFGPALAGLIMAAMEGGRTGVGALLRPLGWLKVGIGWYVFIIFYPLALRLTAVGINQLLGGSMPAFFDTASTGLPPGNLLVTGVMVFLGTLILAGLAEEIGWRGYALPRLQNRYTALVASLILGLIWAPWHYNPLNFPLIRPILPWHVLSVLGMTILLTWVYNSTGGSLGMVVLFHTFSNFSDWIVPTGFNAQGGGQTFAIQSLVNLGMATVIILIFGAENLSRLPRHKVQSYKT
jgi:membrane protease YdiL (CAAX protease family)